MDEWNFENWGCKYWAKTPEFLQYAARPCVCNSLPIAELRVGKGYNLLHGYTLVLKDACFFRYALRFQHSFHSGATTIW